MAPDYTARVRRVIEHVKSHPGDPLTTERLARVAHFSPFHLHRVFGMIAGESLGRFVQRARMEYGAGLLRAQPGLSITDAALASGYATPDGFSRAFRRHFGLAPSTWDRSTPLQDRKIGRDDLPLPSYASADLVRIVNDHGLTVELANQPPMQTARVRIADSYHNWPAVVDGYARLIAWYHAAGGAGRPLVYGISWDDPELTEVDRCHFEWAVEIPAGARPEAAGFGDVFTISSGAQRVARVRMRGDVALEDVVWQYLYRVWLPESRFEPAPAPAVEVYATPPDASDWQRFDMWCTIPIVEED